MFEKSETIYTNQFRFRNTHAAEWAIVQFFNLTTELFNDGKLNKISQRLRTLNYEKKNGAKSRRQCKSHNMLSYL